MDPGAHGDGRQRPRWQRRAGVALLAACVGGCGPWQSTAYLIDAETMLGAARTAQADQRAPYEWTAANLYFRKANEEVGYSDYEQAVEFAKKAVDFATRARDAAQKAARRDAPPSRERASPDRSATRTAAERER